MEGYTDIWYWRTNPIVKLHANWDSKYAEWNEPNNKVETYEGVGQALRVQVDLWWDNPYGFWAKYRIIIDRKVGSVYYPAIPEFPEGQVYCFYVQDQPVGTQSVYIYLPIDDELFRYRDVRYDYRMVTYIWKPCGTNDVTDDPIPAYRYWLGPWEQNFSAIFKKPDFKFVANNVQRIIADNREHLLQRLKHYEENVKGNKIPKGND